MTDPIERQRELLAKATRTPWEERTGGRWFAVSLANRAYVYAFPGEPNAALIVQAVNDRAALLDIVEAADAHVAASNAIKIAMVNGGATQEVVSAYTETFTRLAAALDRLHAEPGWSEE